MNLFFDIETIPAENSLREVIIELERKKEARRMEFEETENAESIFRSTSLSGDFGRIFCIAYALGNDPVEVISGEEEAGILTKFWKIANVADCFVGHNIYNFDLPYIYKRSIVNGIKPANRHLNLSFARYRSNPIYDTMYEWEKWNPRGTISLDKLAKVLGLPTSKDGGIDGSKVYDAYLEKRYDEICKYCIRDVELTRQIYKKMNFEN